MEMVLTLESTGNSGSAIYLCNLGVSIFSSVKCGIITPTYKGNNVYYEC